MPEDIKNLAQTFKRMQSVSAATLRNHRQLIQKCSLFNGPANDVLANLGIDH